MHHDPPRSTTKGVPGTGVTNVNMFPLGDATPQAVRTLRLGMNSSELLRNMDKILKCFSRVGWTGACVRGAVLPLLAGRGIELACVSYVGLAARGV